MARKGAGLTIHAGWYPQILGRGKKPSRRFKTREGTTSPFTVRGFGEDFVDQIKKLAKAESEGEGQGGLSLLAGQSLVPTGVGEAASSFGMSAGKRLAQMLIRLGEKGAIKTGRKPQFGAQREPTWRDITAQEGLDYSKRSTKFALRGNHIWYLNNNLGPRDMAKQLLENRFSFKSGEKWYKSNFSVAGANHAKWARKVLGFSGENKAIEAETIQFIAEDSPMAPSEVKTKDDIYGMKPTGKGVPGKGQPRDIISKELGHIEETEQPLGEHHGMPDSIMKDGEAKTFETAAKFQKFMEDEHIKELNAYVDRVYKIEEKKFNQKVKKENLNVSKFQKKMLTTENVTARLRDKASEANRLAASRGVKQFNLAQARFIRHNVSIVTDKITSTWKEGYPYGERDKKTGTRDYYSVNLDYDSSTMKFSVIGVESINAVSHIAGLYAGDNEDKKKIAADHYITQQNHFMMGKGLNVGNVITTNTMIKQGLDVAQSGIRHTSNVRFSPKDTKAWLDDISNQIGRKLVGVAKEKANEVGNAVLSKARQQRGNSGMFWALPYIGVEEGLYIGK